jgi:hypothetical protein
MGRGDRRRHRQVVTLPRQQIADGHEGAAELWPYPTRGLTEYA